MNCEIPGHSKSEPLSTSPPSPNARRTISTSRSPCSATASASWWF